MLLTAPYRRSSERSSEAGPGHPAREGCGQSPEGGSGCQRLGCYSSAREQRLGPSRGTLLDSSLPHLSGATPEPPSQPFPHSALTKSPSKALMWSRPLITRGRRSPRNRATAQIVLDIFLKKATDGPGTFLS